MTVGVFMFVHMDKMPTLCSHQDVLVPTATGWRPGHFPWLVTTQDTGTISGSAPAKLYCIHTSITMDDITPFPSFEHKIASDNGPWTANFILYVHGGTCNIFPWTTPGKNYVYWVV